MAHFSPSVVEGTHIVLRILTEADASAEYAGWLNDPNVNQYLETRQTTVAELKKYITDKLQKDDCVFWGIFWKENGKHIGNIKLEPIDYATKSATLGIIIGDVQYWGRGVATEATRLAVEYAWTHLGMREVKLGVIAENKAAIRVYEKCGFTTVHVDRGALIHDGVPRDQIWMHIVKS